MYEAIRLQLWIQTIIGVSPFYINQKCDRIVRSRLAESYTILVGVAFVVIVLLVSYISLSKFFTVIMEKSYLYGVIICFEFGFTNLTVPFIIVHSLVTKERHIDFFNRIHQLDTTFSNSFHIEMTDTYRSQRNRSIRFVAISITYYSIIAVLITLGLYFQDLTEFGIHLYSVSYQLEQSGTGILFSAMASVLYLLRLRFQLLHQIWRQQIQMAAITQHKSKIITTDALTKKRAAEWMFAFKELCLLLDLMSSTWGMVLIVRLMHDFTLLVSQMYMIYWILNDNADSEGLTYAVMIVFWMLQNVLKIVGIAICSLQMVLEVQFSFTYICIFLEIYSKEQIILNRPNTVAEKFSEHLRLNEWTGKCRKW